jgi:hypothetical protein
VGKWGSTASASRKERKYLRPLVMEEHHFDKFPQGPRVTGIQSEGQSEHVTTLFLIPVATKIEQI